MSVVKFKTHFRGQKVPNDTKIPHLIRSAKGLCDLGVLDGQSGNLSFRTKNGFIISCANISLAHIKETEFAEVFNIFTSYTLEHSPKQIVVANGLTEPSSESPVHWIIYRAF
ncbi:MAG: class II aldolase/adducin family protein [Bacteroidetes bacterium]|nr:class II aldolase/adducin family protein [Bacteroidota bacterium]